MKHFTASQAKQNFGQLLKCAALAPVAIERHGKVQAMVVASEEFLSSSATANTVA